MISQHWILAITTCVLLTTTVAGVAEESTAKGTANRFSRLLQLSEPVLLKTSANHSMYSIQLLSRQQSDEIKTAHAEYIERKKERDRIVARLETAKRLSERATLFFETLSLESEINKLSNAYRLETYAYVITHIGEDFVTLENSRIQKFVPFRSIRQMYRSKSLDAVRGVPSIRSSRNSAERRTTWFRLKRTRADEVVEVVNKFYPDPLRKLVVNSDSNQLSVTATTSSIARLSRLISILDAEVHEAKPVPEASKP